MAFDDDALEGDGWVFVNTGGAYEEKQLAAGETLRVDTGCIVAYTPSVDMDIQYVGGLKSALFGGEGVFFATLKRPGKVWLQSLPFSRFASRIYAAAPQTDGAHREEGSILGRIGDMIGGNRG